MTSHDICVHCIHASTMNCILGRDNWYSGFPTRGGRRRGRGGGGWGGGGGKERKRGGGDEEEGRRRRREGGGGGKEEEGRRGGRWEKGEGLRKERKYREGGEGKEERGRRRGEGGEGKEERGRRRGEGGEGEVEGEDESRTVCTLVDKFKYFHDGLYPAHNYRPVGRGGSGWHKFTQFETVTS